MGSLAGLIECFRYLPSPTLRQTVEGVDVGALQIISHFKLAMNIEIRTTNAHRAQVARSTSTGTR